MVDWCDNLVLVGSTSGTATRQGYAIAERPVVTLQSPGLSLGFGGEKLLSPLKRALYLSRQTLGSSSSRQDRADPSICRGATS